VTGRALLGWSPVSAPSRRPAVLVALLSVVLVVLSACSSSDAPDDAATSSSAAPTTPTEPSVDPVEWTDCTADIAPIIAGRPGADRPLTFGCGQIEVPLSYDDPTGPTLSLFAVRAVSGTQTDRIGSLVVNPGGPGLSATDAAVQSALTLPDAVLARFDVVGVDPRGVGLSQPVQCISDSTKDQLTAAEPRPTTADQLDAAFSLADDVAAGCVDQYGEGLGAFSTVDSARDLDVVRQAVGDQQLTYLGYSYGTTLGSTYAQLFPEEVRALVLDGAVDPDATRQEAAEAQAQGFEAAFDAFAANCTSLVSGCPIGADPRTAVGDLLNQAETTPIPSSTQGETRQATPGLLLAAVRSALYNPAAWPQLAQSLAAAQQGDSAGVLTLADTFTGRAEDGTYSNTIDANITVGCADTDESYSQSDVRTLVADWGSRYPLFGADAALSLYTCTPWDAPRTPLPDRDAEGAAPILVIGTQGDPVTPLPGAVDMAQDLTSGVLLTWQGSGHTAYPKTQCVTDAVNAYLVDLAAPTADLTCPA
jgi:pimeloyl-ACP methyl ester carboxylesterase